MDGTQIIINLINVVRYLMDAAVWAALASKLGLCRWKAWVPLLNVWYMGEVADECSYRRTRKDHKLRKWCLLSLAAQTAVTLILRICLSDFLLDYLRAHWEVEFQTFGVLDALKVPGIMPYIITWVALMMVCSLPFYFCCWQVFGHFVPEKAVTYFVVGCIPGLSIWVLLFLATKSEYRFARYREPDVTNPYAAPVPVDEPIPSDPGDPTEPSAR